MAADLHDEIRQFRSEMDRAIVQSSMITKFAFFLLGLLAIAAAVSFWSGRQTPQFARGSLPFAGEDPQTNSDAVAPQLNQAAQSELVSLRETINATRLKLTSFEQQLAVRGAPTNEHVIAEVKLLSDKIALIEQGMQAVQTAKPITPESPITDQTSDATNGLGELIIYNKSNNPATVYVNGVAYYVAVGLPVSITAPMELALRLDGDPNIYHRTFEDWGIVDGRRRIAFEIN